MNLREWLSGTPSTKPWLTPVVRRLTTDEVIADSQDIQVLNIGADWFIEQVGTRLEVKNRTSDSQYWSFNSGGFVNQIGGNGGTGVEYKAGNGPVSAPTATTNTNIITSIFSNGYNSTAYARAGSLLFTATENWTAVANGSKFDVQINETGTKDPDTFLSVQGTGIVIGKTATNYTLPVARGTNGQGLISDASGVLTFRNVFSSIFSQIANLTVDNTITESNIIGAGVGSLSFPANSLVQGSSFLVHIGGTINNLNNETLTIRVYAGPTSTTLLNTLVLTPIPQATGNKVFDSDFHFVVRSTGNAGFASCYTQNHYSQTTNTSSFDSRIIIINNTTFSTTVDNVVLFTVQWAVASASNSITSQHFMIEQLY